MNRQAASRPGTRLPDDMVPGDKHAPASGPVDSVLSVRDLHVEFAAETGLVKAVRGLSFDVCAGESLAIVGESGAGKSATSLAIMGLHPATASFRGSIKLHGQELLGRDDGAMSRLRGQTVSMIFQDPLSALTPVYTVGDQIIEAIRVHHSMDRRVAMRRAVELLDLVGIPEPHRRVQAYPHEFSGGMRQRAMIAMAIANDPDVIIADEPTTALDVTIQAQVLEVLKKARDETHAALILVTHDLGVVAGVADRVSVMYAGRVVEQGSVREIFHQPCMPYTIGLLGSIPRPDGRTRKALTTIEGSPPSMIELPRGCPFAPRCPLLKVDCLDTEPKLSPTHSVSHRAACIQGHAIATGKLHRHDVYQSGFAVDCAAPVYGPGQTSQDIPWENAAEGLLRRDQREIVLKLADMAQHYPLLEGAIFRRRVGTVFAVDGIDLMLRQGETLGLVGESGCGKSTTVRAIMELQPPTHGSISVLGRDVAQLRSRAERREMRRDLQVVFQDPMASLDPRLPVFDLIAEPLGVFGISGAPLAHRVDELLALVGLDASLLDRYPSQLSGGQRQRVCIARSLALEPKLLILDEPVSALDVSIRAGVINLLDSLRATLGLSYLLVAHDLAIVRHIADRVAVMYLGTIVETGDVEAVYEHPAHPYTSALLSAMPIPDPDAERDRRRILLEGELPSPTNPPSGCRFHTRCPKKLTLSDEEQRRCVNEAPELRQVGAVKSNTVSNAEAASHVQLAPEPNTLHTSACHYNDRLLAVSN